MKLRAVTLSNVRRFDRPTTVAGIGDGLSVLSAPNEQGKSTLFDALQALFLHKHRSRAREVTALQPHAGGAPEVTAEIETAQGRFTVHKRWLSRPMAEIRQDGRLIAQADAAEEWLEALTGGDDGARPSGLIWVRQGQTGLDALEGAPGKDREATLELRRGLLSSVTGEVEAVTGGRHLDAALRRCREELAQYLTATGKSAKGKALDQALQERAALEAECAAQAAAAEALHEDLQRRRAVLRQLAQLQDPEAASARAARLKEAQEAWDAARDHAARLARAGQDLRAAQHREEAAAERLRALQEARDAATRSARDLQDCSAAAQEAIAARDAAKAALDAASADAERARAAHKSAQATQLEVLRAASAAEDARRRSQLDSRIEGAEELTAEAARLSRAATGPTPAQMEVLERHAANLTLQQRLAEAAAPHVTWHPQPGAPEASLNGAPLPPGSAVPVTSPAALDLPGIGRLEIAPGSAPGGDALREARQQLDDALSQLGLPSMDAAREAAAARAQTAEALREVKSRLEALAPGGLEALKAERDSLPEPLAGAGDLPSRAAAESAATSAADAADTAEAALARARTEAQERREHAARAMAAEDAAKDRHEADLRRLGSDPEERAAALAEAHAQAITEREKTALAHDTLARTAPDSSAAEAALSRARQVSQNARNEIQTLSAELAALDAAIGLRAGEGVEEKLSLLQDRLRAATARQEALEFEAALLQELEAQLLSARDNARERYFAPVMAELRPMLRLLWPDAALRFDGDSLLPTALLREGREEPVGILSGGTQEQLALLVRLAFARLLAAGGHPAPVILDDALVYTDDDRIERMFDALHQQAAGQQIIVLSCRQRAFRELGGTRLELRPAEG